MMWKLKIIRLKSQMFAALGRGGGGGGVDINRASESIRI
jgi:hypothetical protein